MHRLILGIGATIMMAGVAIAQQPIIEINLSPAPTVFVQASWNKPVVIKAAADATKHFEKDVLKKLGESVDFKKQIVLVFAWKGSGQDQLNYVVKESSPEQITFTRKRGMTKDLRPHTKVFALRSNVTWQIAAGR